MGVARSRLWAPVMMMIVKVVIVKVVMMVMVVMMLNHRRDQYLRLGNNQRAQPR